jgi:hypothetical protein
MQSTVELEAAAARAATAEAKLAEHAGALHEV